MKLPLQSSGSLKSFLELARLRKARLTAEKRPCSGAPNAVPPSPRQSWIRETDSVFLYTALLTGETVLPVATTRPELLFGCVCLFIHPENPPIRGIYWADSSRAPLRL